MAYFSMTVVAILIVAIAGVVTGIAFGVVIGREQMRKKIRELRDDNENMLWNLAGCSTIAMTERPLDLHMPMARACLVDVNQLAAKYQNMRQALRKALILGDWADGDLDALEKIAGVSPVELMLEMPEEGKGIGERVISKEVEMPIHDWFELSYAQFLTVPRLVMESMPTEWQRKMATLLQEMDDTFDWRPKEGRYWVRLKDDKGRFTDAPLNDYRHGNIEHLRIRPQGA